MTAPIASGWSESPGGACTHWKAPPFHGARRKQPFAGPPWTREVRLSKDSPSHRARFVIAPAGQRNDATHEATGIWRMSVGMSHFRLACAALAASLVAASAQAVPFSSHDSQRTVPDVTLVAEEECPAGYTLHPRLHLCAAEPTCPPGSILHPRLHLCVTAPTCPSGSTWHPQLHRCVTP